MMLTTFALALALQQAVDHPGPAAPAAHPEPTGSSADLPDWALTNPFGWERAQCSPMLRREPSLEACQARVRATLSAALGERLPAGLQPAHQPVPCLATPGDDGAYPVQCGAPERQTAQVATLQVPDCRPRPTRQGGSVAFVTDCRAETAGDGGLSFRLFGRD